MQIRPEGPGDARAIRAVHDAAFPRPGEGRLVGGAFQALELRVDAIPRGAGLVRYAPEFAALGAASARGLGPVAARGVRHGPSPPARHPL